MALGSTQPLSENEYQEYLLRVKAAGAWAWQPHHLHVPNVIEIWEPKPPGTLWVTPGLLRDSFTFIVIKYPDTISKSGTAHSNQKLYHFAVNCPFTSSGMSRILRWRML